MTQKRIYVNVVIALFACTHHAPESLKIRYIANLSYTVETLDAAMTGGSSVTAIVDLGILVAFVAAFLGLQSGRWLDDWRRKGGLALDY
jgi:hypothetical protein